MSPEVNLELPPEPVSVSAARRAVADLARRVGAPADDVALAVSEAVTNSVKHGFRGGRTGTVWVRAWVTRDRFLVAVADDGVGMLPSPETRGLGMGTPLISTLPTDVRYESSGEGTKVTMGFKLGRAA